MTLKIERRKHVKKFHKIYLVLEEHKLFCQQNFSLYWNLKIESLAIFLKNIIICQNVTTFYDLYSFFFFFLKKKK